jgi:hypothetical protein
LHKKIDLEVVMLRNIWLALLFQKQLAMRKRQTAVTRYKGEGALICVQGL